MSIFGIVGLVIVVPLVLFVLGRRRYYRCMTCPLPDGCRGGCVHAAEARRFRAGSGGDTTNG